nr:hypothetical protein [Tanacetum cinerariifolium]
MENYKNVSQDIRNQLNAEAEAVQIILTGIDNDIYSTVDACLNACEMWKAIERLKQGESINVQDLEANLYWEFEKFTSRDGESLESYYSRSVGMIIDGVERCKQTIAKRTYFGHIDPFIQNTIEGNFCPEIRRINADLERFYLCLKEEMVDDLRYFNSLELEVDSFKSQLETQKT